MCGTAAEVSVGAARSTTARSRAPGPMTTRHRRGVPPGRARRGRPLQGLGRTCRVTPAGAGPAPAVPAAVDIFDTTLRDGAQFEGISLTVDDKLRVAEQLDWLGVRWIEGGYPQANPTRRRVLPPGRHRADARDGRRWWPSARPGGRSARSTSTRRWRALVESGVSTVVHRRQELGRSTSPRRCGTTLDEGVAMVADSVRFLRAEGHAGVLRRRALLRRLQGQPRVRPPGARGRGDRGRRGARAVRHQRRLAAPRGAAHRRPRSSRYFGADQQLGIHTQNDTRLRGGQLGRRRASSGATHVQGTVNGYGERTGNANLMTCHPRPAAQDGHPLPARGAHRAADRGQPPRGRAGQPAAPRRRPLRRGVGLRPQGRAAHLGPRQGRRRQLRARRPDRGRQPHAGAGVRPRRPGRHVAEGPRVRRRPRRPGRGRAVRAAQAARGRGLPVRGGRRLARAADARGRRLGAAVLPARGLPGHHLPPQRRAGRRPDRGRRVDHRHRGRRSRCGSATSGCVAIGEGNGPVNALDAALRDGARPSATPRSGAST